MTEEVLVELNESIDAILASQVHQIHHLLEISAIELPLLGFESIPGDVQADSIEPPRPDLAEIALPKVLKVVGRALGDQIDSMEYPITSLFVVDLAVANMEEGSSF